MSLELRLPTLRLLLAVGFPAESAYAAYSLSYCCERGAAEEAEAWSLALCEVRVPSVGAVELGRGWDEG